MSSESLHPSRRAVLLGLASAGLAGLALPGMAFASDKKTGRKLPQPDPALWDPPLQPVKEGFADVPGGRIYYRVVGDGPGTPLITAHGGPAATHRYMRPYAALGTDRPVVLYDQLGCGKSDAPADDTLYTTPRYAAELDALRAHLGFDRFLLLGHSWGGWLGQYYAAKYADRLSGLVLAGTSATIACMQSAADSYLKALGPKAVATIREAERTGKTDTPEYGAVAQKYYSRHLCRLDPWPDWFIEEGMRLSQNHVYLLMNGPNEFTFTGTLKNDDYTSLLKDIKAPTLVMCGQYDYGSPACSKRLAAGIRGARLRVFSGLSHMSHLEDPKRVTGAVRAFFASIGK
jgi:proline-specific peptidase